MANPDLNPYTAEEIAQGLVALGVARMCAALAAVKPLLEADARTRLLTAWMSAPDRVGRAAGGAVRSFLGDLLTPPPKRGS
jgi:hypothetical protein